tara:strand:- start:996 stop:1877 length:882 start_codon:yes stop_codon:yes gene_type:complete
MSAFPSNTDFVPNINQDFLDLSGCDLFDLPLPDEVLDLINKAISGELFVNPVQDILNTVSDKVGEVLNDVDNAIGSVFMTEDGTILGVPLPGAGVDENGNPVTAAAFITGVANDVRNSANLMQEQSDILSGTSIGKDGFDQNGGVSDMPGIASIQSLASGFNQTANALSNTEELKDNYSQFFGSVLGPGTELMQGVDAALDGDFRTALSLLPRNADGNIEFIGASTEALTNIIEAADSVERAYEAVESLINDERALVIAATEYLVKATFGFSILSMLADPCFGEKVAKKIFNL